MKKATKNSPKVSHKKAKDLEVKPAKGGTVRGGLGGSHGDDTPIESRR